MSLDHDVASRRKFLRFLAASPLLAGSDLAAMAAENPSLLPDPMLWGHQGLDRLIASPKEAINVFDFEPVMFKNVPPAHSEIPAGSEIASARQPCSASRRFRKSATSCSSLASRSVIGSADRSDSGT